MTEVVRVKLPLAPVMVNTKLPVGVVVAVVTVSVEDAPVAGLGLKVAFAPPGGSLTVKETAPVNPTPWYPTLAQPV